ISAAQSALDSGSTIADDLAQDGQFFEAYAAALVDVINFDTAAEASDRTTAVSAAQQLKTDIGHAVQLASAPGMVSGVHDFVTQIQTLSGDVLTVLNAADQTAFDAADAK